MPLFAGVDSCPAGWIVILLSDQNEWSYAVCRDIHGVLDAARNAKMILIDIPIGLKEGGIDERSCDREARKMLPVKLKPSVFRAPARPVINAGTYEEGARLSRQVSEVGISMQAWGIAPKIRQVDTLMREDPGLQKRLRETHPEVCFNKLSNGSVEHSKKSAEGRSERLASLINLYPQARNIVEKIERAELKSHVAPDDILDALAVAVTALLGGDYLASLPQHAEMDGEGIRMEITYFVPKNFTDSCFT